MINSKMRLFIIFFSTILLQSAFANADCKQEWKRTSKNQLHTLSGWECGDAGVQIRYGDQIIYPKFKTTNKLPYYSGVAFETPRDVFAFAMGDTLYLACVSHLMLVDLRGDKALAFDFGISQRCSEPSQAFWSKKKGVEKAVFIVKPDVKFTYMNGKLTPPDDSSADKVTYTSDLLLEEAKKLDYPGGYVHEIPLIPVKK